ncbi:unnamed protein product [Victoria cruziana]
MSDPAWQWCKRVNPNSRLKIKCNFCNQEISGGISRFKHHIAGTRKDVARCTSSQVPAYVRHQCMEMINANEANRIEKEMHTAEQGYGEPYEPTGEESEEPIDFDEEEDIDASLGTAITKGKGHMGRDPFSTMKRRRGDGAASSRGRTCTGRSSNVRSAVGSTSIRRFFPSYTTPGSQPEIRKAMCSKEAVEEAENTIGRWFYDASIPFNAANSFHFQAVADAIASIGPGFKMPSYNKLRGKILSNTVKDVKLYCDELRAYWKKTGCTVMADGWTDRRNRTLATGEMLALRYKIFYWSPCAAHCLNLMLQDLGDRDDMKLTVERCQEITKYIYNHAYVLNLMRKFTKEAELIRPAQTRFATNVLTVQSIVKQRAALRQMFSSDDWSAYQGAFKRKASLVVDIIFNNDFWQSCVMLLKICLSLLKVLRLADSESRPSIGYLYEAMDKAKEAIRDHLKGKKKLYMPVWKVIDNRWSGQLHRPFHAAAYYLNPAIKYQPDFKKDREVEYGILDCIDVLVADPKERDAVHSEIHTYDNCIGVIGRDTAIRCRTSMRSDLWWSSFGMEMSNLKMLAIRILSQTCSATGCERNWSVFKQIHSKKRNRLEHKRLNDLVFIKYNMKLRQRQLEGQSEAIAGKSAAKKHHTQFDPISLDFLDILEEWVEEEPSTPMLDEDDLDFLDINLEGAADFAEGEPWAIDENIGIGPSSIPEAEEEDDEDDDDDEDEDYHGE